MSLSLKLNPARLLADNFRSRQRLGLSSIPGHVQARLNARPDAAMLSFESRVPLEGAALRLWEAMLKAFGLTLDDVKEAPARARVKLRLLDEEDNKPDAGWCWHPALLLIRPDLKKQAYCQLKAVIPRPAS